MPFLEIRKKFRIHYLDPNPGGTKPLILLHGLGVTGDSWAIQFPGLIQSGFRILAPDARGFGRSSYPGVCSVPLMAADIVSLLKDLDAHPATVAGISMGGTTALQLALDYPQFVEKLVLVNTFAALRPRYISEWWYFLVRFILIHTVGLQTQARFVSKRLFPHPEQGYLRQILYEQIMQADPQGYRAAMRALARFDVRSRISSLRAPTLVITGAEDTTVHPKYQRKLVECIPGAKQVIIPEAGHGVIVDNPEAFLDALLAFLNS